MILSGMVVEWSGWGGKDGTTDGQRLFMLSILRPPRYMSVRGASGI